MSRRSSQEKVEVGTADLSPKIEALNLSPEEVDQVPEVGPEENLNSSEGSNRQGLLKTLGKAIGFDITTISLPVSLNEPQSFLTRLCEGCQYSDLLDKAALCESSTQRLLYVSLYAISFYSSAERTGKPFNPLLGETYEYVDEKRNGFKFISEQVSHHPPVGASAAETDTWRFWQSQCLKTKFMGNSLDCSVVGNNNVYLKEHKEKYKWCSVKTTVNNVIVGKVWLDHHGELEITNKTTKEVAKLKFKQCGWFSSGWHEVEGVVYDAKGKGVFSISGKWNDAIYGKLLSGANFDSTPDGSPAPTRGLSEKEKKDLQKQQKKDAKEFKKQIKKKLQSNEPLWVHTIKPLESFRLPQNGARFMGEWTKHTLELAELSEAHSACLPPTDSRLRPDRLALEKGDVKAAAAAKHTLEEKQRAEKRKRESSQGNWNPKYFQLVKDEDGDDVWEYKGNYWEEREARIQNSKK